MPRVRLTAQHVATLPAVAGRRTDYRDVIVPALVLRVSPTSRSWIVRVQQGSGRAGRRLVSYTLGRADRITLAEARDQAREILEHGIPRAGGLTVSDLAARALDALVLTASTRREWERLARREIAEGIGTRPAAELDRATVRAWIRTVARRSKWTAANCLRLIARVYSWAEDEELIHASPLHRVTLAKLSLDLPANDRVLSADELRRLLGALARLRECWPAYCDATALLLLTGVRESAVLGMQRDELHDLEDADARRWVVPRERDKGGRARAVPLSAQALAVVRRRLAATDGRLFPVGGAAAGEDRPMTWSSNFVAELREEMRPVADDCSGPGPADPRWTIHQLRHTMATHLREHLGVDGSVIELLLGHTVPGVAGIYQRAERLPERRAALARWGEWLERLSEAQQGARVLPLRTSR